jgi:hypothetical protein
MLWIHLQSEDDAKEKRNSQNLACDVKKAKHGPEYRLKVLLVQSGIWEIVTWTCHIIPDGCTSENADSRPDDCIGRLLQPRTRSRPKESVRSRFSRLVLSAVKDRSFVGQKSTGILRRRWQAQRPLGLGIRSDPGQ